MLAGGRRQAETDVCSGSLEAEKCPLQSRALAAGTRSGHLFDVDLATGFCNRLAVWTIPRSIPAAISRTCHAH